MSNAWKPGDKATIANYYPQGVFSDRIRAGDRVTLGPKSEANGEHWWCMFPDGHWDRVNESYLLPVKHIGIQSRLLKLISLIRPPIRHPQDVSRLRSILNARGYDATSWDIQEAYSDYSESAWAAGWMGLGGASDEELFQAIKGKFEHDTDNSETQENSSS